MAETKIKFKGDASDLKSEIDSVNAEADGIGSSFAGAATKAGPMIGAAFLAVGAIAGAAFMEGASQSASADRIGASLLLDEGETEKLAEIAGASYANGFGESVQNQQEVVRSAIRGGLIDLNEMTVEEAQSVADRLSGIADITGMGVEEIAQAAGSAMRSGLAEDTDEAIDLLASLGPAVNFDEAISATQEYAPFLRDLGLDAENWAGAMTSSEQTSIQSIDKTGDALKEFGIIMKEETDASREALEDMGLDADEMYARVAAGDPTAIHEIVDALDDIEDPAERARAGVALMGTPFEDLGTSAIPILQDLDTEVGSLADSEVVVAGAYDNLEGSFTSNWRKIKQGVVEAITDTIMPVAEGLMDFFANTVPNVLEGLREWWNNIFGDEGIAGDTEGIFAQIQEIIATVMEVITTVITEVTEIISAIWDEHGEKIMTIVSTVWDNIKLVIETVLGVIQGILDVVMGIITGDWDRVWEGIKGIVESIWEGIKGIVENALIILKNIIPVALDFLKEVWGRIWDSIAGLVSGVWDDIVGYVKGGLEDAWDEVETIGGNILDWFSELPGKIGGFFGSLAETLSAPFRSAFNSIKSLWNNTAGGFGFSTPSWIPGIGGKEFRIPTMHQGGIFDSLTPSGEGYARLLDGERVLSRAERSDYEGQTWRGSGGPTTVIFEMDGKTLARKVFEHGSNEMRLRARV